ncbi:MAG: transglycosylase SLT domain-containing protein [Pseudomonadota bacterium]|nr:transglycosylase SLT domain-containing protein [Pseudomonadota bacterium]
MLQNKVLMSVVVTSMLLTAPTQAQQNKFDEYKKKQIAKYERFADDYIQRYEAFKAQLIEKWGVAELSSSTEYVAYSDDNNVKVIADFENDTIEVSIHEEALNALSKEEQNEAVKIAIESTLNLSAHEANKFNPEFAILESQAAKKYDATTPTHRKTSAPTLLNALGIKNDVELQESIAAAKEVPAGQQADIVTQRTKARLAEQIAEVKQFAAREDVPEPKKEQAEKTALMLTADLNEVSAAKIDATVKNTKSYKIQLQRARYDKATDYLDAVYQQAERWQVAQDTLLAVIETESHFNPMAKSHIPAYGLMQIVPATAGADVNNKVFSKAKKPTPEELFNGERNIEFGSAYFNILMTRYLKEVEDPTSRMYCAIAAYNTGIGNLSRAFNNGERGRMAAIKQINQMTPEQVMRVIKSKTHTETQRYLDKVLSSKAYFAQHI